MKATVAHMKATVAHMSPVTRPYVYDARLFRVPEAMGSTVGQVGTIKVAGEAPWRLPTNVTQRLVVQSALLSLVTERGSAQQARSIGRATFSSDTPIPHYDSTATHRHPHMYMAHR